MSLHTSFPMPTWEQSFVAGQFLQQPMSLPTALAEVSWPETTERRKSCYLALPSPSPLPLCPGAKKHWHFLYFHLFPGHQRNTKEIKASEKETLILSTPKLSVTLSGAASPGSHTDSPLCTIFLSRYLRKVFPQRNTVQYFLQSSASRSPAGGWWPAALSSLEPTGRESGETVEREALLWLEGGGGEKRCKNTS